MVRNWVIVVLLLGVLNFAAWWSYRHRQEHRFDAEIRTAAGRYGVAPALVKAVVWKESRFDPRARGRAGEIGLMQLMEDTAFEWAGSQRLTNFAHEQALHPGTNTLAGTYYLGKALRRYLKTDNPLPYALADYNAGRRNVLRWMSATNAPQARTNSAQFLAAMTYPGTRQYVEQILERRRRYEPHFASGR